jgi:urease accessory protein
LRTGERAAFGAAVFFVLIAAPMEIIRAALSDSVAGGLEIQLPIDRMTLAKRRWRGAAEDGREFGFDLAAPLQDRTPFFQAGGAIYLIAQQPEPVLEIALPTPEESARLGWLIGNLHFTLQLADGVIRMPDDSALRQMLEREHIHCVAASRVFHPFRPGHAH